MGQEIGVSSVQLVSMISTIANDGIYTPPRLVAGELARQKRFDAIICLGAVIRGDTPHFDYVAGEASRGLAQASAEFDVPIGFGLLTCDNDEQAQARAGGAHGNKGWDAALAAMEMADLFDRLDASDES